MAIRAPSLRRPSGTTPDVWLCPARWTWRPSRTRWLAYLWMGLALDLLFVAVYGGANLFNHVRDGHLQLYFDWELGIPLVPALIYPYFSIFVLFLLPPFALDVTGLKGLAKQLVLATLVAGVLFVLLPTRLGFEPADIDLPPLFDLLSRFDLPYNLVPSLHVTYGTLTILAMSSGSSLIWLKRCLWLWLGLMCASVVLVHQHHLLDVFGGVVLALLVRNVAKFRDAY